MELRDRWLNPPEWVEWVDEPVPGYPRRPVPRDEAAAREIKKRTLTNLYNQRPNGSRTPRRPRLSRSRRLRLVGGYRGGEGVGGTVGDEPEELSTSNAESSPSTLGASVNYGGFIVYVDAPWATRVVKGMPSCGRRGHSVRWKGGDGDVG